MYLTPADFIGRIVWKGGILQALDCGLRDSYLDPYDEDAIELRAAWAYLQSVYEDHYKPAVERVDRAVQAIIPDNEEE